MEGTSQSSPYLEFIREYLMKRIVNVQKVISKTDGPLTPHAARMFKIIIKEAGQLKVSHTTQFFTIFICYKS